MHVMLGSRNLLEKSVICKFYIKKREKKHLLMQGRGIHCKMQDMKTKEPLEGNAEFHSILKYCVKHKDLDRGRRVHAQILKNGLLGKDIYVGSLLVSMYARCGDLVRAEEAFDNLPVRDVVTWTSLIAGYAQLGYGEKALNRFQQMQCDGFSPDALTFVCILKACGSIGAIDKGDEIHGMILKKGLLENNILVSTALVDMYGKCGKISKSRDVFDSLTLRNVISWNALIAGCVKHGHSDEALNLIQQMVHEGLFPDEVTFLSILKACGSIGSVTKGKEIHMKVITERCLERTILVGTALIDMYVKCGVLMSAQEVFDELPLQNGVTWNVIIAGYAQHGHGDEAIKHFNRMQSEGISPNLASFISILKVCSSIGTLEKGKKIHVSIVKDDIFERCISVGTALVDMYLKCGAFDEGQCVFNRLPVRDAVLWNTLIAGYAQHGHGEKVLNCLQQMQYDGFMPDAFTFVCILKSCCSIGANEQRKEVNKEIVQEGFSKKDILLGTMYAESDALKKVQGVFDMLSVRDVISWNAIIAYHAQHGHGEEALKWLERMQHEGMSPNVVTFIWVLKSCGNIGAINRGKQIHAEITKKGLAENDDLVGTVLVDMYAKCIALAESHKVFQGLSIQDVVSWTILMDGYAQHGNGEKALYCFTQMQNEGLSPDAFTYRCILKACGGMGATKKGHEMHAKIARQRLLEDDIFIGAAMVDMYVKFGELAKAQEVFEELPVRDLVSWNALVTGYAEQGHGEKALYVFERMQHEGLCPDAVTFVYILKACGNIGAVIKGKEIHTEMVSEGFVENDCLFGNVLVDMYAKCGELAKAKKIFHELPVRDVVSWNVLIAGYAQHGYSEEALSYFEGMKLEGFSPDEATFVSILKACGSMGALDKGNEIYLSVLREGFLENNLMVSTALIDMYAKCGALERAREIFDSVWIRNVVTWNAIIGGYAQHGHAGEALECFKRMQHEGFSPNAITYACALKACGILGCIVRGEEIHADILRTRSIGKDTLIGNSLVDMYIKCGALKKAKEVFSELQARNVSSWTSLISGYAHVGEHDIVIELFKQMIEEGVEPNFITFTVVLNACSHLGLLDHGQMYYESMCTIYGIVPSLEHQTCIVDLFARAGDFQKAVAMITKTPILDYLPMWTALLGACHKWGNVKLGRMAFQHAVQLDEKDVGLYVCMRNIYASAAMQQQGVSKSGSLSWKKEGYDIAT